MIISNVEELRNLYGWPKGRAKRKQLDALEKHAVNFINHSPFFVLSTYDKEGRSDCSPRGGNPGFVQVVNETTLVIPDSKGNNRVDSLVNIVERGSVGCLFLIPGIDETLRINGTAVISTDVDFLNKFSDMINPPKSCLVVSIQEVFLHCAKALMRSELWSTNYKLTRPGFPTMGQMLNDQLGTDSKLESQEDMIKRYKQDL